MGQRHQRHGPDPEGARSDLDAKLISTVPHEGRQTRKLLGWMDDRRERRSRRGGERLRRNLNISSPAISFAFTESIHRIAEKFQHEHAKGRRVFLFSSVSAAEGKSTLAANTAISPGLPGVSVLFIDLDLRRPVQSEMLGLSVKQKNELGTLLSESADPEKDHSLPPSRTPPPGLHSLLSTKSYTDVIELLASDQLAKVVAPGPGAVRLCDHRLAAAGLLLRQRAAVGPVRRVGAGGAAGHRPRAGASTTPSTPCGPVKAELLGCILNDMAHLTAYSAGYGYALRLLWLWLRQEIRQIRLRAPLRPEAAVRRTMEHTTHTNNEEQAIDLSVLLRRMLRALRRLWPVCLALIVLCAAVMGWRAHRAFRPMYRSEAVFSVSLSFIGGTDVSSYSQYYNKSAAQQVTDTFPIFCPPTGCRSCCASGWGPPPSTASISASPIPDTSFFVLTVESPRRPGCLRHPPGRHRCISPGEPPGAGRDAAGGEPGALSARRTVQQRIPGSAAPSGRIPGPPVLDLAVLMHCRRSAADGVLHRRRQAPG
ncbi:MAG: hypothetical protein ACLU38_05195 [Dysosmobacter sp.]